MTDTRFLPDFSENLEWNLVSRNTYVAQQTTPKGYLPLPDQSFQIENSYTLMIGVGSVQVQPNWYLGCWAEQRLLFRPSSTTIFPSQVKTRVIRCQLGTLTLCTFSKLQSPWLLYIRFPWWLEDAKLEVWRYDGTDQTIFEAINATHL